MYDCIVVGLGGMGSAALFHLASRGVRALGIEQFELGHALGASHGQTRIIRQAYFEHPDYVPLLRRAYELWDELSQLSGMPLFHRTGLVYYGADKSPVLDGVRKSSALYQISVEDYSTQDAPGLFPDFKVPANFQALLERNAGYLEVESCVLAHAVQAKKRGAEIHEMEEVLSFTEHSSGVVVKTSKGQYEARSLVLTQGPWTERFPIQLHRQLLFWFETKVKPEIPCFIFDMPYGFFYGFPVLDGRGVKVAHHCPGEKMASAANVDRTLRPEDSKKVEQFIRECIPAAGAMSHHAVCIYAMSPDEHFIIDQLPDFQRVYVAGGFSGHGFKFASVVGEIMADLALGGETRHPITPFRAERLRRGLS